MPRAGQYLIVTSFRHPIADILQILTGIAELLDNPNILDPAQRKAYDVFKLDKPKYNRSGSLLEMMSTALIPCMRAWHGQAKQACVRNAWLSLHRGICERTSSAVCRSVKDQAKKYSVDKYVTAA